MLFDIGRICVKLAGRDAGLKCIIIDVIDSTTVLIDGQTRRRKCNIKHLEPSSQIIKIKKGASSKDVITEFKKLKIDVKESKPKKASPRPTKQKKKKSDISKDKASDRTDKAKAVKEAISKEEKPKPVKEKSESVDKKADK